MHATGSIELTLIADAGVGSDRGSLVIGALELSEKGGYTKLALYLHHDTTTNASRRCAERSKLTGCEHARDGLWIIKSKSQMFGVRANVLGPLELQWHPSGISALEDMSARLGSISSASA